MRIVTVLCAAVMCGVLASGPASAQDAADHWYGGEYRNCDGSTVEVVECIRGLQDKWDGRLNAAYRTVMDAETGAQRAALRTAQRGWITYRDANCAYYAGGEGTIARIEAASCLYVLTRDRAQELEMMLGE